VAYQMAPHDLFDWDGINEDILLFVSVLIFIYNVFQSRRVGVLSGPNPSNAGTLE
jgi:hypothetical protein